MHVLKIVVGVFFCAVPFLLLFGYAAYRNPPTSVQVIEGLTTIGVMLFCIGSIALGICILANAVDGE